MNEDILPEAIHAYEGFHGQIYFKETVLDNIKNTFKKIEKEEVIKLIENKGEALTCDSFFKKSLEHDCFDYYLGTYSDEDGDGDYEHRIMPYIASAIISNH